MMFDPPSSRYCHINAKPLNSSKRVHIYVAQGDAAYSTSLTVGQAESLAQQLLSSCQEVRLASQPEQG